MEKACRNCHYLTTKNVCPVCKSQNFSERWKGFVIVMDADRSEIANQLGAKMPGKYALKLG